MDDVRVWDIARRENHILKDMQVGRISGNEPGLVAYWDFEKGEDPNTLYDRTNNDNHGRIVGAKWESGDPPSSYETTQQKQEQGSARSKTEAVTTGMVLISAGEFQMGVDGLPSYPGEENAMPRHTVYLDAFYIDIYEVTNAQYKEFMSQTGHKPPQDWTDSRFNHPDHPVVGVDWYDAQTYAKWADKRLPTEAEWEKAARGGFMDRRYPWGDTLSHDETNFKHTGGRDKWEFTSPIDSFKPNGYGLYDISGNAGEWCADQYDSKFYSKSPTDNPCAEGDGKTRVVRGGSWWHEHRIAFYSCRATYRYLKPVTDRSNAIGFRCVRNYTD